MYVRVCRAFCEKYSKCWRYSECDDDWECEDNFIARFESYHGAVSPFTPKHVLKYCRENGIDCLADSDFDPFVYPNASK
jgi:hypothetical protein